MAPLDTVLDLSLDYGYESAQYEDVDKQRRFLRNVFLNAVNSAFKDGIGKEYLKFFRDISKKIESAKQVSNPTEEGGKPTYRLEVSLNPHELDFFVEVFDRATWNPAASSLICQIYDRLDGVKAGK